MTISYRTELQIVFEDTQGSVHHGRWSTTRELQPDELVGLRQQFEQAMTISGHTILSLQLVSETESVIDHPRREGSTPVRPKLSLVKGGLAACSAWFLALCSAELPALVLGP